MALSTSIPRAMTRAPSEIRSSVTPITLMKMKVPMMVTIRTEPMMSPLRRPMKINRTMMTMPTA